MRAREKEIVKRRLAALADAQRRRARADRRRAGRRLNGVPGQPRSFDPLDRLLNAQSYRLAHWRVASEEINYRRFFDVNQLAALRMEDPAVFDEVHRFVVRAGRARRGHRRCASITSTACSRPATTCGGCRSAAPASADGRRAVLTSSSRRSSAPASSCRATGRCTARPATSSPPSSTTCSSIGRNERALDDIYRRFVARRGSLSFADLAYRSKKQVLHETMSGDINSLGHQLNRFSERNRHFRDFTLYSLISTLKEVIACFPVYRTYVTADDPVERPRSPLHRRGGPVRQAARAGASPAWCSTSSSGCC